MRNVPVKRLVCSAVITMLMVSTPAMADPEAEVKYRRDVMKAIGGLMGSMGGILRNRIHSEDLATHATAMASLSKVAPRVFPEGSLTDKSNALPSVWEEPEAFSEAMMEFVEAADGMAAAANSGDMSQIGPAIQALGGSCKGCHDDFKKE